MPFMYDDKTGRWIEKRNVRGRTSRLGRYFYVHSCPSSTYEDIQALKQTEKQVSLGTIRKALGTEGWKKMTEMLGYDRHFPISRDWHVGYYKGVYRGIPCYFVRHSGIEHICTLGGKLGPSLVE